MKELIRDLIRRYGAKGILIDTNILLLLFVGGVNRERISKFKRTQQFVPEDYDVLLVFLQNFKKFVITPNILTEVNSLANQLGEPERSKCFIKLADYVSNLEKVEEVYRESRSLVTIDKFVKFGLTDCGILDLAQNQYLVLTDDGKLANYLNSLGIDALNFNHLRIWVLNG
jgi:rRNA-processing protein FCF1